MLMLKLKEDFEGLKNEFDYIKTAYTPTFLQRVETAYTNIG